MIRLDYSSYVSVLDDQHILYGGLLLWGANFHYFRDTPTSHKFSTHEIFIP